MGDSARFCVSPQPLPAGKSPEEEACERIKLSQPQPQMPPSWEPISPYSLFLAELPPPCHCILYHILCGRHGACIYSGSRQPVLSISECKNNPQVALLWPQTLYQQECFPGTLPTHSPLWGRGCHQQEKTPYAQGLWRNALVGVGVGRVSIGKLDCVGLMLPHGT